MGLFEKLFGTKDKVKVEDETLVEAGVCPNCWGHQEYNEKFIEYTKDPTKANINQDKFNKKAFVAQFVETHVTGIRLKKDGDQLVCPSCKGKYKTVSSKLN